MTKKITVNTIQKYKDSNEKFSVLTAYDYSTAKYIDEAGVDIILIGDSLAMVALGYETTHSIGVDEMAIFTRAVAKGVSHAMVVTDMPFLSYHTCIEDAVKNCGKMIKLGANAVKIEGSGDYIVEVVKRLTQSGIPVVSHLGFTPQFINTLGGYKIQGKTQEAADELLSQALEIQQAGAFAILLEMVPQETAKYITENLTVPTISCGAGKYCDAQVLVSDDVFGKFSEFKPKFARKYANLKSEIREAAKSYIEDVTSGAFPAENEIFHLSEEEANKIESCCCK